MIQDHNGYCCNASFINMWLYKQVRSLSGKGASEANEVAATVAKRARFSTIGGVSSTVASDSAGLSNPRHARPKTLCALL